MGRSTRGTGIGREGFDGGAIMDIQITTGRPGDVGGAEAAIAEDAATAMRFYVAAPSVSAVRRALFRAPGGARVVGRHDRETIACSHTMDGHSFGRHWPVLLSRLDKAGLRVVGRPAAS
ncbi:hypothetical protein [Paludisphaera mucosa]|uniref:Uncharacterized protein n=1 Tax=Paludisphaera mucosa TaxID=3030827 RepID=A0ABT6F9I3_9BACT|nr:hypothetical protein [Paludisphaera mucosa]MDG3004248.1 hypothetical protein [Paludisphaera mucosa]